MAAKMRFTAWEREILACVDEAPRGLPRHAAKNALIHLDRAWKLKKRDPEMAVFRAITAEEEAATAIFAALRQCGYANAKKLEFRNHVHKQALFFLFQGVGAFLSDLDFPPVHALVKTKAGRKRLMIQILLRPHLAAYPDPPLHFTMKGAIGDEVVRFAKQVQHLAGGKGADEALAYVRQRANRRNQILYASQEGIASVHGAEKMITATKNRVILILTVYCLIFPHRRRALFVQQVLDSFLLMLEKIQAHEVDPLRDS